MILTVVSPQPLFHWSAIVMFVNRWQELAGFASSLQIPRELRRVVLSLLRELLFELSGK